MSVQKVAGASVFVIPEKAGIQYFKTFWMPDQVRHDGIKEFMNRH